MPSSLGDHHKPPATSPLGENYNLDHRRPAFPLAPHLRYGQRRCRAGFPKPAFFPVTFTSQQNISRCLIDRRRPAFPLAPSLMETVRARPRSGKPSPRSLRQPLNDAPLAIFRRRPFRLPNATLKQSSPLPPTPTSQNHFHFLFSVYRFLFPVSCFLFPILSFPFFVFASNLKLTT